MERVHEPDLAEIAAGASYLRGEWCERVFAQAAPLTLELPEPGRGALPSGVASVGVPVP